MKELKMGMVRIKGEFSQEDIALCVVKVDADKSKVIVLGGDERLVCEIIVDGRQPEYVSEFKYLEFLVI